MKTASDYIKDDCIALLDRVFTGESLTFFGEDGGGQYGRSTFPVTASIRAIDFEFDEFSDEPAEIVAHLRIFLDGYSAATYGFAITDQNLRIDLNRLLKAWEIDPDVLSWADVGLQGDDFITLQVDVAKLLSW